MNYFIFLFYNIIKIHQGATTIWQKMISTGNISEVISADAGNELVIGTDGKLYRKDVKFISVSEFVRTEPIIIDKGRVMFTVHPDLNGYKIKNMTCTIQTLGVSGTLTVQLLKFTAGVESVVGETVSFNSGTTYTGTSAGASSVTLATGDLLYINVTASPLFADAANGLTYTLKLEK